MAKVLSRMNERKSTAWEDGVKEHAKEQARQEAAEADYARQEEEERVAAKKAKEEARKARKAAAERKAKEREASAAAEEAKWAARQEAARKRAFRPGRAVGPGGRASTADQLASTEPARYAQQAEEGSGLLGMLRGFLGGVGPSYGAEIGAGAGAGGRSNQEAERAAKEEELRRCQEAYKQAEEGLERLRAAFASEQEIAAAVAELKELKVNLMVCVLGDMVSSSASRTGAPSRLMVRRSSDGQNIELGMRKPNDQTPDCLAPAPAMPSSMAACGPRPLMRNPRAPITNSATPPAQSPRWSSERC